MNNIFDNIKTTIISLSKEHQMSDDDIDGFKDAELIEHKAEQLIVAYAEKNGYLINGFPTEKKQLPEEELEEDYFCRERYQLYLDTLATQKDDVAELMWCYVSSFWVDQYESKEEYLQSLQDNLDSGVFYNIKIDK
jgi:Fe-S cluster assembly scaffold protein SufB